MSEIPAQEQEYRKQIHVVGGGTIEPVREHLALVARAYGGTARRLGQLCTEQFPQMDVNVHLTRMADPRSMIETSEDLRRLAYELTADVDTKVVFWNPAVVDFQGQVGDVPSAMHAERLSSSEEQLMKLSPADKIVDIFRTVPVDGAKKPRKDIVMVGFKTTTGASPEEQFSRGLRLMKNASLNLVLANDTKTRNNMIILAHEAPDLETTDRELALRSLVELAYYRAHLTFPNSLVRDGQPVPWESDEVFPTLRAVVDYCREQGAYKAFDGKTAGHFAAKIDSQTFLTSIRKSNFNELDKVGLVRVETEGSDDHVIAYGAKPSVGGQSQRSVFEQHPEADCIVHFHCPPKPGAQVNTVSQREYECGSYECGENTARGLMPVEDGEIKVVYLDNHGPNIVFHHSVDPQKIINFIAANFDLSQKTGGYIPASA